MKDGWVHPNTITGDAATDARYLRREYINEEFWREVRKGNHILFVAPRRVGKTSIMKDLAENCPEGFVCVYEDIEGVKTRDGFYQRIFELILQCADRSKLQEAKAFLKRCFEKYSIKEITKSGIKIENNKIDFEREIRELIPQLRDVKIHAVIFLDEFAEVMHKFRNARRQDAIDILHTLREIRHDDDFSHFTIVYAGSIGLESVIKNIDRPKLINDLHHIKLGVLSEDEANALIKQVTQGASIKLSDEIVIYLKQKIEYFLPYYLQLVIETIDDLACKERSPEVTKEVIDQAFERILCERKNFEDWLERLKDYQRDNFAFINEILKHAAHVGIISIQTVYDKSKEFGRTEDYMDFIDDLVRDGYLIEFEARSYRFVTPFLKQFWLRKYPIYEQRRQAI